MLNQKIHHLTQISEQYRKNKRSYYATFKCDCGREFEMCTATFKQNGSKTCSCEYDKWKDEIFYDDEVFAYIPNYPGFFVSNYGKVCNNIGKILKQHLSIYGYKCCCLRINNKPKVFIIHRLMAFAFLPNNDPEKTTVDHIDQNRTNNLLSNLRWVTRTEQIANQKERLSVIQTPVLMLDIKTQKEIRKFDGIKEVVGFMEKNVSFDRSHLLKCLNNKKPSAYGYIWKYDIPEIIGEEWEDYESKGRKYQISNMGRVKRNNALVQNRAQDNAYIKRSTKGLHRIIAELFIPNPLNLPDVNHKNGDKTDNRVSNLEWSDSSLNAIHAINTGLRSNVKKILHLGTKENPVYIIYHSARQASKDTKFNSGCIHKCCNKIYETIGEDHHKFIYLEEYMNLYGEDSTKNFEIRMVI